jgi:hypothetical protein
MGRARLLIFLAVVCSLSVRSAQALDLSWPGGAKDLTIASATTCTLYVRSTTGDTLFRAPWRLVWRGTADVPEPLVVLNDHGTPQVPGPSAVFPGLGTEDSVARATTAVFQMTDSLAYPRSVMYLLSVHPSLHARVTVAPLFEHPGAPASFTDLPEVTVNGGCSESYPPLIFSCRQSSQPPAGAGQRAVATSATSVTVHGIGLAQVASASLLRPSHGNTPEALEILVQSDTSVVASLPSDLGLEAATIVFTLADGTTGATTLEPPLAVTYDSTLPYITQFIADGSHPKFGYNPWTSACAVLYDEYGTYGYTHQSGCQWVYESTPQNAPTKIDDDNPLVFDALGSVYSAGYPYGNATIGKWTPVVDTVWTLEELSSSNAFSVATDMTTDLGSQLVAYSFNEPSPPYRHLMVHEGVFGQWTNDELVEYHYGSVGASIDVNCGSDSVRRVVYVFWPDTAFRLPQIRMSHRRLPTDLWIPEILLPESVTVIRAVSVGVDPLLNHPIIAWTGDLRGQSVVGFFLYDGVSWWQGLIARLVHPCWQVSVRVSPSGVQHFVYYERPDPTSGSPARIWHTWGVPWVEERALTQRPGANQRRESVEGGLTQWQSDIVVCSDSTLGMGDPVWPFAFMLPGESPMVGFEYRDQYGMGKIYLAYGPPFASSVSARPATQLIMRGPWPNPGLRGKVGRISFEVQVRQELEFSLFDVTGKRVMREVREASPGSRGSLVWNLGGLRPGVYWLRGLSSTGQSVVRKWVIVG